MKIKHSKLRNFKLVTGRHYFDVAQDVNNNDAEKRIQALQVLTLGLYLLDVYTVTDATKEYKRLQTADAEAEKFDILDNVDVIELQNDLMG